jgi:hypothetical protein
VIRKGLTDFINVGEALARVRDLKLYRKDYKTFEEYVEKRWGFKRAYASRLINTAGVGKFLLSLDGVTEPTHESQLRPLIGLEHEKAKEIWELPTEKAKGVAITEALVQKALKGLSPRRMPTAKPQRPSWAALSKEAKSLLSQAPSAEKAMKSGKDAETGLKFIAAVKELLELLAKSK